MLNTKITVHICDYLSLLNRRFLLLKGSYLFSKVCAVNKVCIDVRKILFGWNSGIRATLYFADCKIVIFAS